MCGRYSLTTTRVDLARELGLPVDLIPEDLVPRWNVAPTQPVAALRRDGGLRLELFQWGLVPAWSKDPSVGGRMINARAETLAEKPSFRDSFRDRRCLLPADGFYEWKPGASPAKTPYYIRMKSGEPFTFAGLWSVWRDRDGRELRSCAIVTGEPNPLVATLHDRMPVIIPPVNRDAWLDPEHRDAESLSFLLRPYPAEAMEAYAVTRRVNKPEHDDPGCIEAAPEDGPAPPTGTLSLFD